MWLIFYFLFSFSLIFNFCLRPWTQGRWWVGQKRDAHCLASDFGMEGHPLGVQLWAAFPKWAQMIERIKGMNSHSPTCLAHYVRPGTRLQETYNYTLHFYVVPPPLATFFSHSRMESSFPLWTWALPRVQIKPCTAQWRAVTGKQAGATVLALFRSPHSANNRRGLILSTCPTEGFQKCAIHSPTPFGWDCSLQLSPKFTNFIA